MTYAIIGVGLVGETLARFSPPRTFPSSSPKAVIEQPMPLDVFSPTQNHRSQWMTSTPSNKGAFRAS